MNDTTTAASGTRTPIRGRRRTFGGGERTQSQYDHELIDIARVVRVVKGGRRFRFRASVVVGDRAGTVGFGVAKSQDLQQAIAKAQEQASKNVMTVSLTEDGTIAHTVRTKYKAARIFLKPAKPGTGVIAGSTIRAVAELAGIKNLVGKSYGSPNKVNGARATIKALSELLATPDTSSKKKSTANNT